MSDALSRSTLTPLCHKRLDQLDTLLALVLKDAAAAGARFRVVQTLRTLEEHLANVKNGKTRLKATDRSKHMANPQGLAEAADLVAVTYAGKLSWSPVSQFWDIAELVREAAVKRGVRVRWGGSWVVLNDVPMTTSLSSTVDAYVKRAKKPFVDAGHFETVLDTDRNHLIHLEF